jgi:hypothetical protein
MAVTTGGRFFPTMLSFIISFVESSPFVKRQVKQFRHVSCDIILVPEIEHLLYSVGGGTGVVPQLDIPQGHLAEV